LLALILANITVNKLSSEYVFYKVFLLFLPKIVPGGLSKKETAKFIIQLIASIASAILTALGATSCVGA
jgi:hypothetical protein